MVNGCHSPVPVTLKDGPEHSIRGFVYDNVDIVRITDRGPGIHEQKWHMIVSILLALDWKKKH